MVLQYMFVYYNVMSYCGVMGLTGPLQLLRNIIWYYCLFPQLYNVMSYCDVMGLTGPLHITM